MNTNEKRDDEDQSTSSASIGNNSKLKIKNINNEQTSLVNMKPQMGQHRIATVPGKPRGATYDGNVCMVCSDRASGFHYGVLACEGCKGFFKRVCKEKDSKSDDADSFECKNESNSKRHCIFGGNCEINVRTRNRCQYCRIQKCIELGMSKDGIKLGRRSKKFKQNLNSTVANSNTSAESNQTTVKPPETIETINDINNNEQITKQPIIAIFQDNKLIFKAIDILTAAASVSASSSSSSSTFSNTNEQPSVEHKINESINEEAANKNVLNGNFINLMIQQPQTISIDSNNNSSNNIIVLAQSEMSSSTIKTESETKLNSVYYSMLDATQLKNIIEAIVQAHRETSTHLTTEININDLTTLNCNNNPVMKNLFETGLLAILNETKFLENFNNLIENAVLFAKNVPYFMNIHETDRIALLKSCVFEIICVRHANYYHFESSNNLNEDESRTDLATLAACAVAASFETTNSSKLNDMFMIPIFDAWAGCEWLCEKLPQLKNFILMLADFYRCFSVMNLDETEVALFCSYLLFNSVDQNLNDSDKLINYRGLFNNIVINELEKKRSMHKKSEFQVENTAKRKKHSFQSIHSWLNSCCKKLKDLNNEHAKVLLDYKQFVQFPDLYAELYNL